MGFLTVLSTMIEYRVSGCFLPVEMLSYTHCGLTTWTLVFDFVVKSVCVLDPLSCWEAMIWVARAAVNLRQVICERPCHLRWNYPYRISPPAAVTIRFISLSVVSSKKPLIYTFVLFKGFKFVSLISSFWASSLTFRSSRYSLRLLRDSERWCPVAVEVTWSEVALAC